VKTSRLLAAVLLALPGFRLPARADDGDAPPTGQFNATAKVDTSMGTRQMGFSIVVSRPMTRAQALPYKKVLENGGQAALLAVLRQTEMGQFQLGAIAYPINLIVAEKVDDGFRYFVVTARNFDVGEVDNDSASLDYPFAVAIFDVPDFGSGDGSIYPKAALSIDADGHVQAQGYNGVSGTLEDVELQD
jgi:hypothetical protein